VFTSIFAERISMATWNKFEKDDDADNDEDEMMRFYASPFRKISEKLKSILSV
jgi:hypothetical protein